MTIMKQPKQPRDRCRRDLMSEMQEDALLTIERLQSQFSEGVECQKILAAMTLPTRTASNLQTLLTRLQFRLAATDGETRRLRCRPGAPRNVKWRVERKGS